MKVATGVAVAGVVVAVALIRSRREGVREAKAPAGGDAGGRARHRRAQRQLGDLGQIQRRPALGSTRSIVASVSTRTAPSRSIASRLERSTADGSSGQGVRTTAATSSPTARAASTVSSVWLIVPRPGGGGDHDRQRQLASEVAHQVAERQRDQQPADALADEEVGARPAAARAASTSRAGSIALAGQLGAEVRGDRAARSGTARSRRRTGAEPGGAAKQRVVRARPPSSRPLTAGLNTATRSPAAASVRAITAATTVLPDLGAGAGDEDAAQLASARRRGEAARGAGSASGRDAGRGDPQLAGGARDHLAAAQSSSARWLAITERRRREVPVGHGRRPDRLGEHAALERPLAERHRAAGVADHAPGRSGCATARRRGPARQRLPQHRAVSPQLLDHARLAVEQRERRERRRPITGGGRRGREDERPRGVDQQVDDLGARADVGAVAAERLAERADDHVHLAGEPGLGDRAAPARPERAGGVRLVDHQAAAVAARQLEQLGDRGDVAVHREDRVGDDQRRAIARLAQPPGQVLEVGVAVDEPLGARDPAAVDDARVVELVREDDLRRGPRARRSCPGWPGSPSRTGAPPRSR